jgi:Polyketide cyclase / dehydrase and lipid transport
MSAMTRQEIHEQATTTASPAAVYALLRDGASWTGWSPIESVELEHPGREEREGVGAVRILRSGKVTGRDTIAELVPDRRFAYTHASSLPVRDYRGAVDLEPRDDGGTDMHWRTSFRPAIPGTGPLMRRGLGRFIGEMTRGLAEHATDRAGERGTPLRA